MNSRVADYAKNRLKTIEFAYCRAANFNEKENHFFWNLQTFYREIMGLGGSMATIVRNTLIKNLVKYHGFLGFLFEFLVFSRQKENSK